METHNEKTGEHYECNLEEEANSLERTIIQEEQDTVEEFHTSETPLCDETHSGEHFTVSVHTVNTDMRPCVVLLSGQANSEHIAVLLQEDNVELPLCDATVSEEQIKVSVEPVNRELELPNNVPIQDQVSSAQQGNRDERTSGDGHLVNQIDSEEHIRLSSQPEKGDESHLFKTSFFDSVTPGKNFSFTMKLGKNMDMESPSFKNMEEPISPSDKLETSTGSPPLITPVAFVDPISTSQKSVESSSLKTALSDEISSGTHLILSDQLQKCVESLPVNDPASEQTAVEVSGSLSARPDKNGESSNTKSPSEHPITRETPDQEDSGTSAVVSECPLNGVQSRACDDPSPEKTSSRRVSAPILPNNLLLICEQCSEPFAMMVDLNEHYKTHATVKPYSCQICNSTFSKPVYLKRHQKVHSGEKPYKCDVCGSSFTENGSLKKHKRIHAGDKPYACEFCQSAFCQKIDLVRHLTIHTGEKPYICHLCESSFARKAYLREHLRKHSADKPFKCELCNVSYKMKASLKLHNKIHTGEKPFSCDFCNATFYKKTYLKKHKEVHSQETPYVCGFCNANFHDKLQLKKHLKVHTNQKCDMGEASVPNRRTRKTKKSPIHIVGKRFACDFCEMSFAQKSGLGRHIKKHTSEKSYKCEVCGATLPSKDGLEIHTRLHTGKKPYKCEFCDLTFRKESALKKHINMHLPLNLQTVSKES